MLVSDVVSYFFTPSYFNYLLYELVNYFFCIGIVVFVYKLKLIKFWHSVAWSILFLSPLFFNYFLFDPSLFGDQFSYSQKVGIFREIGASAFSIEFNSINDLRAYGLDVSSLILSLSPVPLHLTVTSIAFSNRLMMFLIFIWLYNLTQKEYSIAMFLIPSLILYSSLSLRDPMIILLSVCFIYLVLKNKFFLSFFILTLIALLKFQNAILFLILFLGRFVFNAHKSIPKLLIFIFFIILLTLLFEEQIVSGLNFFRFAFFLEDLGRNNVSSFQESVIVANESFFSILISALISLPKFIIMPSPLSASGILQLMQSIENLLLIYVTILLFNNSFKSNKNLSIFLLFSLLIGLGVYAYVIFNVGTGVRYKFVYLYPYLIIFYLIASNKDFKSQNYE